MSFVVVVDYAIIIIHINTEHKSHSASNYHPIFSVHARRARMLQVVTNSASRITNFLNNWIYARDWMCKLVHIWVDTSHRQRMQTDRANDKETIIIYSFIQLFFCSMCVEYEVMIKLACFLNRLALHCVVIASSILRVHTWLLIFLAFQFRTWIVPLQTLFVWWCQCVIYSLSIKC